MSDKYVTNQLYLNYKLRLIKLSSSLKPCTVNVNSLLEKNDKGLIWKSGKKDNFKLGDRVKIKLKKRQLKQVLQDNWNEAIAYDIGKIGTIISILPDGENEPYVYFPNSEKRWVINALALENVSSEFRSDGSEKFAFGGLQVGDNVELAYEDEIVEMLQGQAYVKYLPAIKKYKHRLGRILSFDCYGNASVGINNEMSLVINSAALQKRSEDFQLKDMKPGVQESDTSETKKTQGMQESDTSETTSVYITNNLQSMIKQPFWNYRLTEVLGAEGKVTQHGFGQKGVEINRKIWILPVAMYATNKSESTYVNETFPFKANEEVVFSFAHHYSFERTLEGLRLPPSFTKICQDYAIFLGYENNHTCIVQIHDQRVRAKVSDLLSAYCAVLYPKGSQRKFVTWKMYEKTREDIKVGDEVQLDIGPRNLARDVLKTIKIESKIKKMILSTAKLVAFNDDEDKALLEFQHGEVYSIDPNFVTVTDPYSEPDVEFPLANSFLDQTAAQPFQPQETYDAVHAAPSSGVVQQNDAYYSSTKEIVSKCSLIPERSGPSYNFLGDI